MHSKSNLAAYCSSDLHCRSPNYRSGASGGRSVRCRIDLGRNEHWRMNLAIDSLLSTVMPDHCSTKMLAIGDIEAKEVDEVVCRFYIVPTAIGARV